MNINDYNIGMKDGILIVTSRKKVTKDDLLEIKILFEESTGHTYRYGTYKDLLGYYHCYDFEKDYSIYCGSLNESAAIKAIKNYKAKQNE